MKKVNTLTIARAYFNYLNSNLHTLNDCYTTHSHAKAQAYKYCLELFAKYDGTDFRIISYNTMRFTVGFIGWYEGRMAFFYITADYDRVMFIDDIQAKISKI